MKDNEVQIFEVGPRDGLQNEAKAISLNDKIWFVTSLLGAGIQNFEFGAFVRPDRVPQMADTGLLWKAIQSQKKILGTAKAWVLVPNRKGLQRAIDAGVTHFAVFTAASESFTQRNIGMSIKESLKEFKSLIQTAQEVLGSQLFVRGYVSTAFGCPFEGLVAEKRVLKVVEKLAELGVRQVSIGDTIGVATPNQVRSLIKSALHIISSHEIAVHFHDTRGTALANTLRALDLGIRIIDSSAGGLGGCPFAPGASGNLATEDLVYMLNGMGIQSGVRLDQLCKVSLELSRRMKRPLTSRYLQSYMSQ